MDCSERRKEVSINQTFIAVRCARHIFYRNSCSRKFFFSITKFVHSSSPINKRPNWLDLAREREWKFVYWRCLVIQKKYTWIFLMWKPTTDMAVNQSNVRIPTFPAQLTQQSLKRLKQRQNDLRVTNTHGQAMHKLNHKPSIINDLVQVNTGAQRRSP